MCSMRGRAGQIVGQGFSGSKTQLGVKMSKTVKKVGSLNLKTMIEEDKLIFNDYEIISELTTFISKHNSFEAEEGCNDDLGNVSCHLYRLVAQDYFKELTDQDVRKRLYEEQKNQIEQDMKATSVSLMMDLMIIVLWMKRETGGLPMNTETRGEEWTTCGTTWFNGFRWTVQTRSLTPFR